MIYAERTLAGILDEGWEELAPVFDALASSPNPALAWIRGPALVSSAEVAAHLGRWEEALDFPNQSLPWLNHAPAWAVGFPALPCGALEVMWLPGVLTTRYSSSTRSRGFSKPISASPGSTGGWPSPVCTLAGRHDDATAWFTDARRVLEDAGQRPLRAVVDFDEALMLARRGGPGDPEAARPLLTAARRQFESIGMTGWLRRADELAGRLGEGARDRPASAELTSEQKTVQFWW